MAELSRVDPPVAAPTALERIGTALATPVRRRVLLHLISGPAYPSDLAELLGVSRAVLSNHLACLRDCGLVRTFAEGRRVRYELATPELSAVLAVLAELNLPGHCDEGR